MEGAALTVKSFYRRMSSGMESAWTGGGLFGPPPKHATELHATPQAPKHIPLPNVVQLTAVAATPAEKVASHPVPSNYPNSGKLAAPAQPAVSAVPAEQEPENRRSLSTRATVLGCAAVVLGLALASHASKGRQGSKERKVGAVSVPA